MLCCCCPFVNSWLFFWLEEAGSIIRNAVDQPIFRVACRLSSHPVSKLTVRAKTSIFFCMWMIGRRACSTPSSKKATLRAKEVLVVHHIFGVVDD